VDLSPTKIRVLHKWYLEKSAEGLILFLLDFKIIIFFKGRMVYGVNLKIYGTSTIKTSLTSPS
jgi:hypothetical protein